MFMPNLENFTRPLIFPRRMEKTNIGSQMRALSNNENCKLSLRENKQHFACNYTINSAKIINILPKILENMKNICWHYVYNLKGSF